LHLGSDRSHLANPDQLDRIHLEYQRVRRPFGVAHLLSRKTDFEPSAKEYDFEGKVRSQAGRILSSGRKDVAKATACFASTQIPSAPKSIACHFSSAKIGPPNKTAACGLRDEHLN